MNKIKVFEHEQFGEVRAFYQDETDQVWFVGKDMAKTLGYKNVSDALGRHIDIEDKDVIGIHDSIGRLQNTPIINESGMYSLVLRSNLPQAGKFKRWVTSEVLPSIRKHGAYMTPDKIEEVLLNPDTLIQLATNLKEEQEKRRQLEIENNKMKPKALFAEAVETSESSILIGELAKLIRQNGYEIGQNRLFEWLRQNGYLIKKKGEGYNSPTQRSMDMGLMEIKKNTINDASGNILITRTPKITGKGQIYFINKFVEAKEKVEIV